MILFVYLLQMYYNKKIEISSNMYITWQEKRTVYC